MTTFAKIQDAIEKVGEEETKVREELNQFIIEAEKEHGPLADKLVTLDEKYQVLADLELVLMDIRRRGNIITHEKTAKIVNTKTLSQETIESVRKDLEEHNDNLSAVYKAAQPKCSDKSHLCHKLETVEKFVEVVHDKYTSYLRDKSIGKELHRLQYTIKLASFKAKELERNVQDDDDEEDNLRRASHKKSFQESLPLPGKLEPPEQR